MACKYCGSDMHSSLMCFKKPQKPLRNKKLLHRVGPVLAKWMETRSEWIRKNATASGTWKCYYGPEILGIEANPDNGIQILTLDHKLSRSRHPELRFDLDNLVPSCAAHNHEKGSKSAEEYTEWLRLNAAA